MRNQNARLTTSQQITAATEIELYNRESLNISSIISQTASRLKEEILEIRREEKSQNNTMKQDNAPTTGRSLRSVIDQAKSLSEYRAVR